MLYYIDLQGRSVHEIEGKKSLRLVAKVVGSVNTSSGQEEFDGALDISSSELRELANDVVDVEAHGRRILAELNNGGIDVSSARSSGSIVVRVVDSRIGLGDSISGIGVELGETSNDLLHVAARVALCSVQMCEDALQEVMCDDIVVAHDLNALSKDATAVWLKLDGSKHFNVDSLAPLSLVSIVVVRKTIGRLVNPELDFGSGSTIVQLEGEVCSSGVGSKLVNLTNYADLSNLTAIKEELILVLSRLSSLELLQCDGDD